MRNTHKLIALMLAVLLLYVHPVLMYGPRLQLRCRQAMRPGRKSPLALKGFYGEGVLRMFTPGFLSTAPCQHAIVVVGEYPKGGFNSVREFQSTLRDFIGKRFDVDGRFNYQVKLQLDGGSPALRFMDDAIKISLARYFNVFTTNVLRWRLAFTLVRIALSPWEFPQHFDCADQVVGVLHGNRTFHIGREIGDAACVSEPYELHAGDALYLPAGTRHSVTTSGTDLSILFSFGVYPAKLWGPSHEDSQEYAECQQAFSRAWPQQSELVEDGKY
jgi:mannose-6-phosphate isomerase-like protein (cupin superfamily)